MGKLPAVAGVATINKIGAVVGNQEGQITIIE